MIKKIIFDIDDTLIPFPKNYSIGYAKLIKKFKLGISVNQLYNVIGKFETCGKYDFYNKKQWLDFINCELNLNLEDNFYKEFIKMYNNLEIDVSSNIKSTLKYLSSKYSLIAYSNWFTESQVVRLKKAGIFKYFKNVYGSDIIEMKPNKDGFMKIIDDSPVVECLVIGDNLNNDIKIPYELGFNVLYLGSNNDTYPSIKKIDELKEML